MSLALLEEPAKAQAAALSQATIGADEAASALRQLEGRGWAVVPGAVPAGLLATLREELTPAVARRDALRQRNRVDGANDGTLHHLLADHPAFVALLDHLQPFEPLLQHFFGGPCVLNSYGGVVNRRASRAYVHAVHRDVRFWSDGRRFMLNLLVMLDDFTLDNGATWLLSGSHRQSEKPADGTFVANAERATGRAGSFLFFDSRLWHAAGDNQVDTPRRALTLTFTPPFFKPQIDHCRLLGEDAVRGMSPLRRQLIGWNARVPASLDEYYVPAADRCYQRGQD